VAPAAQPSSRRGHQPGCPELIADEVNKSNAVASVPGPMIVRPSCRPPVLWPAREVFLSAAWPQSTVKKSINGLGHLFAFPNRYLLCHAYAAFYFPW